MGMVRPIIIKKGEYKGELLTRVPSGYLKKMARFPDMAQHKEAVAEIKRRNLLEHGIDLTGHAVDKASLECIDLWKEDAKEGEGLFSWLARIAEESLEGCDEIKGISNVKRYYKGLVMKMDLSKIHPLVITVYVDVKRHWGGKN